MFNKDEVKKKALEFLKGNRVATISTASRAGEPQASAVYYVVDDDFMFYFLTAKESRKVANLKENPRIAFTIWQDGNPITIQGGGTAELLPEGGANDVIQIFDEKFNSDKPFHWPILQLPLKEGFIGVKFTPSWMVYLNLDVMHPEDYKASYSQIIP